MKPRGLAGSPGDASAEQESEFDARQSRDSRDNVSRLHQRSRTMVARLHKAELLARNEIVAAPAERACMDQTFELPTVLYGAMAAFFFAFLTVMTVGFPHGTMVLPMAVNVMFV